MNAKIACVSAHNLPLQVELQRHGSERALLIAHPLKSDTVFAMSDSLARAGVQVGMLLYQTRQLAPEARIVQPDEITYHALHGAIETALRAFSPAIETVALGEILVDVRGLEPHFATDQVLTAALRDAAQAASGLTVQVGLAAGKFVAQQAAQSGEAERVCVVAPGEESRFVAPLSLTTLPHLPGEFLRRLHLFDLYTLGDLARLPKPAVLRQFGGEFSTLYELARGHDLRPLNPDVPPLRLIRSMRLNTPVGERTILLNVVTKLSQRMNKALVAQGYHAEALKLSLTGEKSQRWEVGQSLKPPTSDETTLCRIAAQMLGRLAVNAPIESVVLSSYPLRSWHLGLHQRAFVEADVPAKRTKLETTLQLLWHRFGETIIRIAALVGPPVPIKIKVRLNAHGLPALLTYGNRNRAVMTIEDTWRDEWGWWSKRTRRDYFRVLLSDNSFRHVFQDLLTSEWYLDRAWLR